ncbi:hypothetical protein VPH35_125467 [Triticum aestivum]
MYSSATREAALISRNARHTGAPPPHLLRRRPTSDSSHFPPPRSPSSPSGRRPVSWWTHPTRHSSANLSALRTPSSSTHCR